REHRLEVAQVLVGQLDVEHRDVRLEVPDPGRAGDGNDVLALRQHPRERDLRGGAALRGCELLDSLDQLEVLLEVLALEARVVAPEIAFLEVVGRADPPGEEAAAKRAVGDEADAELADRRQDLILDVPAPERVLGLQGGDRVDGERAVDRRDRLALVRRSVELGHTHAPEAQRGGLEALRAEATRLHDGNLPVAKTSPSRSRTRPAVSKSSFSTARRRASSSAARSASRRPARRSTSARDIATYSRRVT